MDSLSNVAVFVHVVNESSFTKAAERLGLSRSVVSKHVTNLEEKLGAQLLHRSTRRLSLTEAGKVFYERSKRGLEEIEGAESEVSRLQEVPRGKLRINSPMSFGILHIAPLIADFMKENPEILIDMNLDDRKVDVIEEGFDVSIRITDMPDSSLIARRLGPCRHAIVAAPSYLEKHGTPETPADLRNHNIIAYQYQASATDWHFGSQEDEQVTVPVSGSIQMNNSLALREAILGGVGITRTPTFIVGEDIAAGRLVPLLKNFTTLEVSIYLVYPKRRHLSPKTRAFVDFVMSRITTEPYWDSNLL